MFAYLLALRLSRDHEIAQITAALLLVDGLYFVQARTAMLEMLGTVFMMGALGSLYSYLLASAVHPRGPLLRVGLFLGLALATKWNAAYPAALVGLVAVCRTIELWRLARAGPPADRDSARAGLLQHLIWVTVSLIALPGAVYLFTYIPFFLSGHDWSQFVELQRQIYHYHTSLKATHAYQSQWWQWPLALRPVWYHVQYTAGGIANIYAQGEPPALLGLPSRSPVAQPQVVQGSTSRARGPAHRVLRPVASLGPRPASGIHLPLSPGGSVRSAGGGRSCRRAVALRWRPPCPERRLCAGGGAELRPLGSPVHCGPAERTRAAVPDVVRLLVLEPGLTPPRASVEYPPQVWWEPTRESVF